MGRIKGLSLFAEFEDGDYFGWEDGRLWLSALSCSDEMVRCLSLDGDRLIGFCFDV